MIGAHEAPRARTLTEWIDTMAKTKAAPSRGRNAARAKPTAAPSAKPRGTGNPSNLKAILANRAAKPKLADLRAQKETTAKLVDRVKKTSDPANAKVLAQHFGEQAKDLKKRVSKIESDYAARAEKSKATKSSKAEAREATLKALAGGRDELRAHALKLGIVGRSKMNLATLRSEIAKAAAKTGRKLAGVGIIAAPAAAAIVAYDATRSQARAAGIDDMTATARASMAALVAGGTVGGIGIGINQAVKAAGPVVGGLVGKLAWPIALGFAGYAAREGYKESGAPGAIKGALDSVTLGLASVAKHEAEQLLLPPPEKRTPYHAPRSSFATANATYTAMQEAKVRSTAPRGWANSKVQAAAQAAKGNTYTPR